MKGMQDGKGPITSSSLNKMLKMFEAIASCLRSGCPSAATAVATTVEQTVQSMLVVSAHVECSDREVSRQAGVS